jgi:hypothetical protein
MTRRFTVRIGEIRARRQGSCRRCGPVLGAAGTPANDEQLKGADVDGPSRSIRVGLRRV